MKAFILKTLTISLLLISCQKSSIEKPAEAQIIAQTCGGTVLHFISPEFGEEWINNFGDTEKYDRAALTADLEAEEFQEGDIITFTFEVIEELNGLSCDIPGLPDTKIKMNNIKIIR